MFNKFKSHRTPLGLATQVSCNYTGSFTLRLKKPAIHYVVWWFLMLVQSLKSCCVDLNYCAKNHIHRFTHTISIYIHLAFLFTPQWPVRWIPCPEQGPRIPGGQAWAWRGLDRTCPCKREAPYRTQRSPICHILTSHIWGNSCVFTLQCISWWSH